MILIIECQLTFSLSSLFSWESLSTCFFILSNSYYFLRRHFRALLRFCKSLLSLFDKSGCCIFFSIKNSWLLVDYSSSDRPSKSESSLYSSSFVKVFGFWEFSKLSSSPLLAPSPPEILDSYFEEVLLRPTRRSDFVSLFL
jgi:hypothetical protein